MSRRLEKSGESFVYHIYFYKPEEDISAVQTKLDELDPLISTFSDSTSSSDFQEVRNEIAPNTLTD